MKAKRDQIAVTDIPTSTQETLQKSTPQTESTYELRSSAAGQANPKPAIVAAIARIQPIGSSSSDCEIWASAWYNLTSFFAAAYFLTRNEFIIVY